MTAPVAVEEVEGRDSGADALPPAQLRSSEPSALAVRIVFHATWIMFVLLFLVAVIGPHIPSGE